MRSAVIAIAFLFGLYPLVPSCAEIWSIPLSGNAYRTAPSPGNRGIQRRQGITLTNDEEEFSVFFHVDRPAAINLTLKASVREGSSVIETRVNDESFTTRIDRPELTDKSVGRVKLLEPGYVRVDMRLETRDGEMATEIAELIVSSDDNDLTLDYVANNDGNMFYWGRRGPSVHLTYPLPKDVSIRYGYSEITVPEGQDPIGTYYMANGFREGYFGIQVNSATERRVLFSVWSPFKTDNPRDIPEDQRIVALGKGPGVHLGEFGNEGSGGQSYLVYPWKAGTTYRFLTEVRPDGKGQTTYTSWFGDKAAGDWRLIASFRRPKTDTSYQGFHSFLESFSPAYGFVGRQAQYGNVWVCDTDGQWHECTKARFSVDATGRGRHRLDYTGGEDGNSFFLRNCGFFDETGSPGTVFSRQSTATDRPKIDFESLPRE